MPVLDGLGVLLALRSEYATPPDAAYRSTATSPDRGIPEYGDVAVTRASRSTATVAYAASPNLADVAGKTKRPAVIVLTSFREEDRAMEAVPSGPCRTCRKPPRQTRVIEGRTRRRDGRQVLDPGVAARLVHRLRERAGDGTVGEVSARERDVLAALSRGRQSGDRRRPVHRGKQTVKVVRLQHIDQIGPCRTSTQAGDLRGCSRDWCRGKALRPTRIRPPAGRNESPTAYCIYTAKTCSCV